MPRQVVQFNAKAKANPILLAAGTLFQNPDGTFSITPTGGGGVDGSVDFHQRRQRLHLHELGDRVRLSH